MKHRAIALALCASALSFGLNAAHAGPAMPLGALHLQEYRLNTHVGHVMAIQLPATEKLDAIEAGYPLGYNQYWQVNVRGNTIFIRAVSKNPGTNMIVKTDKQLHNLKFSMDDKPAKQDVIQLDSL